LASFCRTHTNTCSIRAGASPIRVAGLTH
jgi:hypothetical protein